MPNQLISNELYADVVLNPWDTKAFEFDVWDCLNVHFADEPMANSPIKVEWDQNPGLYVAKIAAHQIETIDSLTQAKFHFRDLALKPTISLATKLPFSSDLGVRRATPDDISQIEAIASTSFQVSRYHSEPSLRRGLADRRYALWVANAFASVNQVIFVCEIEQKIGAFFIVEARERVMYWHLTAVAPKFQGRGLGKRMWSAMANLAQAEGYAKVETSISAMNTPVLNLYRKLGAEFSDPTISLHRFQKPQLIPAVK